tara:strand:- start:1214 stop:1387 length:174 start_codon:yes stop_codon:yes gene_type:complete
MNNIKTVNLKIEIDLERLEKMYKATGMEIPEDFVKGFANKLNLKDYDNNLIIKVIEE